MERRERDRQTEREVATDEHEAGVNLIDLYVAQTPSDNPGAELIYRTLTTKVTVNQNKTDNEKAGVYPATTTVNPEDFQLLF